MLNSNRLWLNLIQITYEISFKKKLKKAVIKKEIRLATYYVNVIDCMKVFDI